MKTLAATAAEDQALLANWLPLQEVRVMRVPALRVCRSLYSRVSAHVHMRQSVGLTVCALCVRACAHVRACVHVCGCKRKLAHVCRVSECVCACASCCVRASAALSLRAVQAGEEATIAFGEHGEDEVYFETDDESEC